MKTMLGRVTLIVLALLCATGEFSHAVVVGQVDDFENGTTMWAVCWSRPVAGAGGPNRKP